MTKQGEGRFSEYSGGRGLIKGTSPTRGGNTLKKSISKDNLASVDLKTSSKLFEL